MTQVIIDHFRASHWLMQKYDREWISGFEASAVLYKTVRYGDVEIRDSINDLEKILRGAMLFRSQMLSTFSFEWYRTVLLHSTGVPASAPFFTRTRHHEYSMCTHAYGLARPQ